MPGPTSSLSALIAYEMLTGKPPFDIASVDALRASVAEARPQPLTSIDPESVAEALQHRSQGDLR